MKTFSYRPYQLHTILAQQCHIQAHIFQLCILLDLMSATLLMYLLLWDCWGCSFYFSMPFAVMQHANNSPVSMKS